MMPSFKLNLPPNWQHVHLNETDSTMLQLRKPIYANAEKEFVLLTTDYQTAGRGQRGSSWEATLGKNLLFGFLFHPAQVSASRQFLLSEALALAVRAALVGWVENVTVKWPNDVYWGEHKLCGMLLEHDLCGTQIATTLTGVGVNVNQLNFESDAPNPISIRQITGKEVCRTELLESILLHFERRYRQLQQGNDAVIHKEYMQHLFCAEGWHTYADEGGSFRAKIDSISPMGVLRLKREDGGFRDYAFKQVKWVK